MILFLITIFVLLYLCRMNQNSGHGLDPVTEKAGETIATWLMLLLEVCTV